MKAPSRVSLATIRQCFWRERQVPGNRFAGEVGDAWRAYIRTLKNDCEISETTAAMAINRGANHA